MFATTRASRQIEMAAFVANCFPITLKPKIRNGKFISTSKIEIEMPVFSEVSSAIPVAPPSIKLLGSKKPSKPSAAQPIPAPINKQSFINRTNDILNLRNAFPRRKALNCPEGRSGFLNPGISSGNKDFITRKIAKMIVVMYSYSLTFLSCVYNNKKGNE